MDNQKLFLTLIEKHKLNLKTKEIISNNYKAIIFKFEMILNSLTSTNQRKKEKEFSEEEKEFSEEEIEFIKDNDTKEFIKLLNSLLKIGYSFSDVTEIKTGIKKYKTIIEKEFNDNEEVQKYNTEIIKLNKIIEIIESGFNEDLEPLFDFLYLSWENKFISLEEFTNLNLYILQEKCQKLESNNNIKIVTVEITKNDEMSKINIEEEIKRLFSSNNYNYEGLDKKIKEQIISYAKLENIKKVIEFLKLHNLKEEDLIINQITISNLFIYYDEEAINKINEFLQENNRVTLNTLLKMGSIFFQRKIDYIIRDNTPSTSKEGPPEEKNIPVGSLDSFIQNIEIYKKLLGLPTDYKITDNDLKNKETFFTTPNEVINKNLYLLRSYGLISLNEDGSLKDKETFYTNSYCLGGRNIEYILDRCIESGLYSYVKKYKTILQRTDFPIIWYKIKRAKDINEEVFSHNYGLKKEFTNDKIAYNGILRNKKDKQFYIQQDIMPMEELLKGNRSYPTIRYSDPYEYAEKEFLHFYKYKVYTPEDIIPQIKYINSTSKEKIKSISDILKDYYLRDKTFTEEIFEDEIIRILESKKSIDGQSYILTLSSNKWPDVNLLLSRPKVLKICSLLKQNNLWINNKSNIEEIASLILISLTKDSILSEAEMSALKIFSLDMATKIFNERKIANYKGVKK